jgi:hypothetical protein
VAFVVWFAGHRRAPASEPIDVVAEEHSGQI